MTNPRKPAASRRRSGNRSPGIQVRLPVLALAAIAVLMLTACSGSATAAVPTGGGIINMKIDAKEAKSMLDANKNAILLDVRTVEENRAERIPGSTLIPITELPNRLAELPKDPKRPILVYCRSGNRSAQAAAILKQAGFPAVYDFGGIIDWPYEKEKG